MQSFLTTCKFYVLKFSLQAKQIYRNGVCYMDQIRKKLLKVIKEALISEIQQ